MSDDGADLNMPAEGAMRAALGGPQPERLTDEEFERRIRTANVAFTNDYDSAATYAARLVLEFLEAHPEHRDTPIEPVLSQEKLDGMRVLIREGLYDVMKDAGVPLAELGLSGFQWGWAANAARNVLRLPHQPNPAIVELES